MGQCVTHNHTSTLLDARLDLIKSAVYHGYFDPTNAQQ